ncbi:amino acid permease [Sphingomonas sp. RT2P30]|uniref:amino acid permease n=1 Tax=Parasphingomonas halimpatiens TaxID=3096162 RepID=UPI002FC5A019
MPVGGTGAKTGSAVGLRRLGLIGFTLSALSPAASIFITGSVLLKLAGTGTALVLIVGAAIATLAALLYAEVAGAAPHAGGIYAGLRLLLGVWASDITIALTLMTAPAYLAFSAKGLARYLGAGTSMSGVLPIAGAALIAAGVGATLKLRSGILIAMALLVVELLAVGSLVGLAATGIVRPLSEVIAHPLMIGGGAPHPANGMALAFATIAATFACSGAVWGSYLGEETGQKPPQFGSTLALVGLIGALLVAVPLILVTLAIPDLVATLGTDSPLTTFVAGRAGDGFARLLGFVIVAAIFANLLTMTIALSRFVFATCREGIWPAWVGSWLGRLDRRGVPVVATLALVIIALPLLLLSEQTLVIALSAELISPLLVALAVVVGRRSARGVRYRVPAYPLLPLVCAVLACAFLLLEWNDAQTGRKGLMAMAVVILIQALTRAFLRWRRRLSG